MGSLRLVVGEVHDIISHRFLVVDVTRIASFESLELIDEHKPTPIWNMEDGSTNGVG